MSKTILVFLIACLSSPIWLTGTTDKISHTPGKITVAAYYFPNYHTNDPRNIKNKGKD